MFNAEVPVSQIEYSDRESQIDLFHDLLFKDESCAEPVSPLGKFIFDTAFFTNEWNKTSNPIAFNGIAFVCSPKAEKIQRQFVLPVFRQQNGKFGVLRNDVLLGANLDLRVSKDKGINFGSSYLNIERMDLEGIQSAPLTVSPILHYANVGSDSFCFHDGSGMMPNFFVPYNSNDLSPVQQSNTLHLSTEDLINWYGDLLDYDLNKFSDFESLIEDTYNSYRKYSEK